MNIITQLVRSVTKQLTPFYKDERIAYNNAWDLVEALTNVDRSVLFAQQDFELSEEQKKQLTEWIRQIKEENKPIQYILGTVPFLDLNIYVEPPTLIPRPETEEWCAKLIMQLKELAMHNMNILDLCTGSGCIALSIAQAFPDSTIYATDISTTALALAQKNAIAHNITNVHFIQSDVYQNIPDIKFDLIVANPPYITSEEFAQLEPTVTAWEDPLALTCHDSGLKIIKKTIAFAPNYLQFLNKELPQLWIEIGSRQASVVSQLFEQAGFEPQVLKDLYGNERVVVGKFK